MEGRLTSLLPRIFRSSGSSENIKPESRKRLQRKRKPSETPSTNRRLSYANSSVSASTMVSELGTTSKPLPELPGRMPRPAPASALKVQRAQRALEQFPTSSSHEQTTAYGGGIVGKNNRQLSWADGGFANAGAGELQADANAGDRKTEYSEGISISSSSEVSQAGAFWNLHDRKVSVGSDESSSREIVDAMVDDMLSVGGIDGWHVDEGMGTFNDVLGSANAIHPVVLAFARAHIEDAYVCLGVEHIWLAVLQGLAAMLGATKVNNGASAADAAPAEVPEAASIADISLPDVWQVLRDSSTVPRSFQARSGHEVRVFGADMYDRHSIHTSRGAAPLAMAAAVAGTAPGDSASKRRGCVERGRLAHQGRSVAWQPQHRQTNPEWVRALASGRGVRGLSLTGSLQAWSSLCALSRQLKDAYSGRDRAFDWWLHRVYLLCRDLADYYASQDDFYASGVPDSWRQWFNMALFDGHSGAPRGTRLDGWLGALFSVDASGQKVHSQKRWWIEWELVPSGVDLLRVAVDHENVHAKMTRSWVNLFSGFVGVQQLGRSVVRSRAQSRTLQGEDLEDAFGIQRECAKTLTPSQEDLTQALLKKPDNVPVKDLQEAYASLAPEPSNKAIAPLLGWALDH
ncbi:hypothetical protein H4R99_007390 [Coemansia sp. RSA 1722]|nr:hypothetical protein H4R99_007390 [Coemansia sp. RSA 1722]KAJ2640103.1 hypothetical protein GGF40_000251 [Coemansia sp. RSA 1286]